PQLVDQRGQRALRTVFGGLFARRHHALDHVEQRRAAQPGAGDRELDAPRTEIDREDTTGHDYSSLRNIHAPFGTGGFLTFCGTPLVSPTPVIVERIGGNTYDPSLFFCLRSISPHASSL